MILNMNMMKIRNRKFITLCGLIVLGLWCGSCESFLELDPPNSKISREPLFSNEGTAEAALTGLYQTLFTGFASGSTGSVTVNAALAADELDITSLSGAPNAYEAINQNEITADNASIEELWSDAYAVIYGANAMIEGLGAAKGLSGETVRQLTGEALFVRAFTYFYLVNLFGEVPLITDTDYRANAAAPLSTIDAIYSRIMADLEQAEQLVDEAYPDGERFRPNRATVIALRARVSLYRQDWARAEALASAVISLEGMYRMEAVGNVFLKASQEALWQRMGSTVNANAAEAALFLTSRQYRHTVTESLYGAFDAMDSRRAGWLLSAQEDDYTYQVPYKYKVPTDLDANAVEYSLLLRLAEQYLIRAEARTNTGDLPGAIADLDVIRGRAGLPLLQNIQPDIGAEALMDSILVERQRELFTEWGHRWLDLKRTGRAMEVLAPLKPGFTEDDLFFPIPESDLLRNSNLN